MTEKKSTRRKFLQFLGLSAGATLASTTSLGNFISREEVRRLNSEQQEFMMEYGKWMDEFIEVIRIQKTDPGNMENNKKMIALTETAEQWQPRLTEFMKDETFALIYHASIERMKKEI
ncbi:MAG: hypothetical protein NT126_12945 [Bacteroidetes bacterium]|nr:hypothetical protein [Bacteroidota bacterium]